MENAKLPPAPDSKDGILALEVLENHEGCSYLSGNAGTGKSTLVRHFLATTKRNVLVFGTTGSAAIEVGGMTVHRFFGIFPEPFPKPGNMKEGYIEALKLSDTIVIDEGSMLRADVMDALDQTMRRALKQNVPFGGKRVIIVWDILQLGPVVRREEEADFNGGAYLSPYFFSAKSFRQSAFACVELTTPHRHCDPMLLESLDAFRDGKPLPEHIAFFNGRVVPEANVRDGVLKVFTRNSFADEENERGLRALPGEPVSYTAEISGDIRASDIPVAETVVLKAGARVMLARNVKEGMYNGKCGTVLSMSREFATVMFDDGRTEPVYPITWESFKYEPVDGKVQRVTAGTFRQLPLRLAYGVTIHRVQGSTFDRCTVYFKGGIFAAGQAYVALSRCRTLEGMSLVTPVEKKHAIVHPAARKFTDDIRNGMYDVSKAGKTLGGAQMSFLGEFGAESVPAVPKKEFKLRTEAERGQPLGSGKAPEYPVKEIDGSYVAAEVAGLRDFLGTKWGCDSSGIGSMDTEAGVSTPFPEGAGGFVIGNTVYGARFDGSFWEPLGEKENAAFAKSVSAMLASGLSPSFPELVP